MTLVLVGCLMYWQVPALAAATGIDAKVWVYVALILIGFCIYGQIVFIVSVIFMPLYSTSIPANQHILDGNSRCRLP